jgi:hypothetical protein
MANMPGTKFPALSFNFSDSTIAFFALSAIAVEMDFCLSSVF